MLSGVAMTELLPDDKGWPSAPNAADTGGKGKRPAGATVVGA